MWRVRGARAAGVDTIAEPEPRAALERVLAAPQRTVVVGGSLDLACAAIGFLDAAKTDTPSSLSSSLSS